MFALAGAVFLTDQSRAQEAETGCPRTAPPIVYGTGTLNTRVEHKNGVEYHEQGGVGALRLASTGGAFRETTIGLSEHNIFAAAADFNGDGWDDFVAGDTAGQTRIFENHSFVNLGVPGDWGNPFYVLQPYFWPAHTFGPDPGGRHWMVLAAGDFDGDGKPDVFRASSTLGGTPTSAKIWLNTGPDATGAATFAAPYDAMAVSAPLFTLGRTAWNGTNVAVVDYNNDRRLDLVIGSAEGNGGSIRVFLNSCNPAPAVPPPPAMIPCVTPPKFTYLPATGTLIEDMDMGEGTGELPVFAYADFDGDGLRDLVAGSPLCCADPAKRLRMWRGVSGGGLDLGSPQSIPFVGAATAIMAADFSLDGQLDLVVATEGTLYGAGAGIGGKAYYFINNGTATPFSDGHTTQLTDHGMPTTDYDTGFVINYDNDPLQAPDVAILDGESSNHVLLANRSFTTYVPCGEAISEIADLGPLAGAEIVITAARLRSSAVENGGSITWHLSNEDPPQWVEAVSCGDSSGDVCATFPTPVGRDLRWKAVMCSSPERTRTPIVRGVELVFDYIEAQQHLRSGVVISDGVAYVGSFSQPGHRGRLYALNAGLSQIYWELGARLDAMLDSARTIYTTTPGGGKIELRMTGVSTHDDALVGALGAADAEQAQAVISWVRSARFGLPGRNVPQTRLGGIELSTPAVVGKPGLPLWYTLAGSADRALVDRFLAANSARVPLVLVGSRDGMIHAVRSDATNISSPSNGTEAWAFVPRTVASRLLADYTASLSGPLTASAYPDGSPTIADVKINGELRTVAVIGSGNGGKSVAAIDITRTVEPASNAVLGPTPLWDATPGGADAGQGYAKPVIARVKIDGQERFVAIAGTGVAFDDVAPPFSKGRVVAAYDIATGAALWRFQTACPLTSHIAVFETDDDGEPGAPTIDGYMDRAVFADRCGYLYKVDPARNLAGGWNDNAGLGTIQVGAIEGRTFHALFSTAGDPTLGDAQQRPISGTIAARADSSGDVVLYFGTGGLEEYDPTRTNAFYAVYARNGQVINQVVGECSAGRCEKFYGGVVVTMDQVIFTRSIDRQVGTGICDRGRTYVDLRPLDLGPASELPLLVSAAAVGSLYGDANAVYFATLSGDVVRIGTPRASEAGQDTASGNTGGLAGGQPGDTGSISPLTLMGWRQVF